MPDQYMSTGVVTVVLSRVRFLLHPALRIGETFAGAAQRRCPCRLAPDA